ncbi:MAG: hypothetical protein ACJ8LN_17055 [Sulfurifustis sp.]
MSRTKLVTAGIGALALFASFEASAINYFELEVYPYQTASKGEVELENFTTHTSRGTKDAPEPDNNKGLTRTTFEFAYGVTDKTEVAYYRDYARARGDNFEYAASRYRVRTRFFEKGELPVDLGAYAELEYPHQEAGEENEVEAELRLILEKDFGRWTFDLNPIFEKALKGPDREEGWELQYAMSLIYRPSEYWQPRLDMFGDFGPIRDFEPRDEQKHLISPAVDFRLGRGLFATLGVAFGLTDATEQRLVRARIEWEF